MGPGTGRRSPPPAIHRTGGARTSPASAPTTAASIEYSLRSVVSFVERYGDDDTVLVVLGDHQPSPVIIGPDASRDVPISVVARDPAVLDRIAGWGWQPGSTPTRARRYGRWTRSATASSPPTDRTDADSRGSCRRIAGARTRRRSGRAGGAARAGRPARPRRASARWPSAHGLDRRVVVLVVTEPLDPLQRLEGGIVRGRQVLERQAAQRAAEPRQHVHLEALDVDLAERRLAVGRDELVERPHLDLDAAVPSHPGEAAFGGHRLDPAGRHRRHRRRRCWTRPAERSRACAPTATGHDRDAAVTTEEAGAGRAGSPAAARPRPPARPAVRQARTRLPTWAPRSKPTSPGPRNCR